MVIDDLKVVFCYASKYRCFRNLIHEKPCIAWVSMFSYHANIMLSSILRNNFLKIIKNIGFVKLSKKNIMTKLFNISETHDNNHLRYKNIKKVDVLYELEGDSYKIADMEHFKTFVCVSGSCDFCFEKDGITEQISLENGTNKVETGQGICVEIKNYTPKTKIVVNYLEDTENE